MAGRLAEAAPINCAGRGYFGSGRKQTGRSFVECGSGGRAARHGDGDRDLDDLLDDVEAGLAGADGEPPLLARPTAWLFGNEAWGLQDSYRALADAVVRVPIHGRAESLNLATAATVCLYASARAQRPAGRRRDPGH